MRVSIQCTALAALVLCACGSSVPIEGTATTANTPPPANTGPDPDSAACGLDAPEEWNSFPLEYPGEEFMFDAHGNLVTVADWAEAAWIADYDMNWTFLAPFDSDEVAGVDILLNGDIVVCDEGNGAIQRITPQGSSSLIKGSVASPNSVAVRDTGAIFATAFDTIIRIDPDTGESTEVVSFPGQDLDGLTFSPKFHRLWFNIDNQGTIFFVKLDEFGDARGLVDIEDLSVGYDAQLDGQATDECGNIYVIRTDGRISRIRSNGEIQSSWLRLPNSSYTSALHFGSGIGGWKKDHLYVMERNGTMFELDVGINGAKEPHLP